MNWIIAPLKSYAVFAGRARRSQFFAFLAFVTALTIAAHYWDARDGDVVPVALLGMGILEVCVTLVFLLPTIALGVRRLHDSGRSGIWMLLIYGPWASTLLASENRALSLVSAGALIVGGGAWLIQMLLPGTRGTNRYGTDPRTR
jgi:uncharacterized membrane protein YhaH (DUF805 family)